MGVNGPSETFLVIYCYVGKKVCYKTRWLMPDTMLFYVNWRAWHSGRVRQSHFSAGNQSPSLVLSCWIVPLES